MSVLRAVSPIRVISDTPHIGIAVFEAINLARITRTAVKFIMQEVQVNVTKDSDFDTVIQEWEAKVKKRGQQQ